MPTKYKYVEFKVDGRSQKYFYFGKDARADRTNNIWYDLSNRNRFLSMVGIDKDEPHRFIRDITFSDIIHSYEPFSFCVSIRTYLHRTLKDLANEISISD